MNVRSAVVIIVVVVLVVDGGDENMLISDVFSIQSNDVTRYAVLDIVEIFSIAGHNGRLFTFASL